MVLKKEKHPNRVICPRCGKVGTKQLVIKHSHGYSCGPYWYVYHRVGNKVKNCYIGKTWPTSGEEKNMGEGMANMVAVWVPKGELEKLDDLVKKKLYPNRDEAFRFAVHDLLKREG